MLGQSCFTIILPLNVWAIFNDTNMTKHNRKIIVKSFQAKTLRDTPACSKVGC